MTGAKRFRTQEMTDVVIVELTDSRLHDMLFITDLHDELLEFVETRHPQKLLVDFRVVSICSTAVINSLLRAKKRMLGWGGQLKLCEMQTGVRDAYRMLNLDGTVFEIHDDRGSALASFVAGSDPHT